MLRKMVSYGGMLLLAGAAVLVTPGAGQAQHHGGGGHGGGGHGGGFHHGGFSHGGFHHGGFNQGGFNHGGFNHGAFHHGAFHHGAFHHGAFHHGFHDFHHGGWWYPRYYGYYGAWPYYYGSYPDYGDYGYYPYSYDTYSDGSSSPAYDSGYYDSYGNVTSFYPDSGLSGTAQPDTRARITVSVPADAEIWFNDTKTTSTDAVREYQSPPLAPGTRYAYEVRARWNENGHEVTQTQQVEVTAGTRVSVHFPVQPTKASTAPSH